jgi:alcohol dehydrogenase
VGALGNLALEDDELLSPPPGHLRVRVYAVGLNFADIFAILGVYSATPKGKFIPGLEFAGRVEAVGMAKDVGKHDADRERARWLGRRVFGITRFGGYATYVNADARYCRLTPAGWSDTQASGFLVSDEEYSCSRTGAIVS